MNCFLRLFRKKKVSRVEPEQSPPSDLLNTYADKVVLNWKGNDMSAYHWWPMREDNKKGGTPDNNLYAQI